MIQKIKTHKATPEEAIQFIQHLTKKFPLTNQRQLVIEFLSTNSTGRHAHGRAFHWPVMGTIYIEVALGTRKERRPLSGLLHTIAHEYCHALQYDQERAACCKEADLFGKKEVVAFLREIEGSTLGRRKRLEEPRCSSHRPPFTKPEQSLNVNTCFSAGLPLPLLG